MAMNVVVTAKQVLSVGTPVVVESESPAAPLAVVFEDDGETGYFYALDPSVTAQPIVDALHIYNVVSVSDRDRPSTVEIGWSPDSLKVVLFINGFPHAIFDFSASRGYCRTGYPPPTEDGPWSSHSHAWSDKALEHFGAAP